MPIRAHQVYGQISSQRSFRNQKIWMAHVSTTQDAAVYAIHDTALHRGNRIGPETHVPPIINGGSSVNRLFYREEYVGCKLSGDPYIGTIRCAQGCLHMGGYI